MTLAPLKAGFAGNGNYPGTHTGTSFQQSFAAALDTSTLEWIWMLRLTATTGSVNQARSA